MQPTNEIEISIGASRFDTKWKQETTQWNLFCLRLASTHRTAETHKEFMAAKPKRQDEIKDIGGFVGGLIKGGRRTADAVINRRLITLDVDFAHKGFWDDFQMMYGNAACLYSTHKHTSSAPRLRLIMPLDRPVFGDEYQAIARRIAGNLGIECFDQTTFQAERLMYWPSTPKDGEYVYEQQEGNWLSADEVLDSYHDWRDISQWPVSDRFLETIKRGNAKLGNPLEKSGIVGAFCRTYSMTDGIAKYLGDVYEKTDDESRYTYAAGSTSGGLVVYDDLFAYSHHGTDPASGRGVNVFDLVRLHRYSNLDSDVDIKTPINKYPSHLAMEELASRDEDVRGQLGADRMRSMQEAFKDVVVVDEAGEMVTGELDAEWTKELDVDRKGNIQNTIDNVVLILENDPWLKGRLSYNAFACRQCVTGNLPWRGGRDIYWNDSDDANLRLYLEKHYKISAVAKIEDALEVVFLRNQFHPVRDYLKGLVWDGVERVSGMLSDYLGAEDNEYVRAVSRKMLCGAIARVFRPGIKFDTAIILVGPQGAGKSTFIRLLGLDWYSDSFGGMDNNRAFEQIQGAWLIEIGELSGMKKAEVNEIKHFMSKGTDTFRPAYARRVQTFPRQCVFFGTTNDMDFLQDPTGNRRYWPVNLYGGVSMYNLFTELTRDVVDQLWAEAIDIYRRGETLHLSVELEAMAKVAQAEHTEENPFGPIIDRYLKILFPVGWDSMGIYERRGYVESYGSDDNLFPEGTEIKMKVCIQEVWAEAMKGDAKGLTRWQAREIGNYIRNLPEWYPIGRAFRSPIYGVQKGFEKRCNLR